MRVLFILLWWSLVLPSVICLAGAFAFSDPKGTSVKLWAEPFSACCSHQLHAVSLPYLTSQSSSPVSLLLFAVWTERLDQSKSELQPASPSPASLLTCSSAQIFQQLRCSQLLETSKRTQNLKQKDRASSLCEVTMCHVMLGKSWDFLGWSCVPLYN